MIKRISLEKFLVIVKMSSAARMQHSGLVKQTLVHRLCVLSPKKNVFPADEVEIHSLSWLFSGEMQNKNTILQKYPQSILNNICLKY